ncbi:MAG TPA: hypothetical protein VMU12_01295 [Candidatus Paceibacterota bacterium]|nr:hypothetical protein [Candidatus Paceibacterota bacterium]
MPDIKIELKKTYLAMIRNTAKGDVRIFRNLFATVDGQERDLLEDGKVSCAVFVSSLLYLLNSSLEYSGAERWIRYTHATVGSTEKDLQENGWVKITEPREGAILSWEPILFSDGNRHGHIGFFIGNDRAISNASNGDGVPREHHWTYDGTRNVERIWWHPALDEE